MSAVYRYIAGASNRFLANMFNITSPHNGKPYAFANDKTLKWRNAAGTADLDGLEIDADDNIRLGEQMFNPAFDVVTLNITTLADVVDQVFYISDGVRKIESIYEVHKTKDTDSAAVTATIRKSADGVTIANGTAVATALSLKTTDDTVQAATLSTTTGVTTLAENDRRSVDFTNITDAAGICIVMVLSPGKKSQTAVFRAPANAEIVDRSFFVANRPMVITGMKACVSTAGTNGSAVVAQVTKDTTTDAPGAGDDILTNNTAGGFNLKNTINTVEEGALDSDYTTLLSGDYLTADIAGTTTAAAGLFIQVEFQPNAQYFDVAYFTNDDGAAIVDAPFFIAPFNCEIVAINGVWDVVSSGATNVQVGRDTGTTAAGSGVALISNDSNAGLQSDAGARTPESATWVNAQANHLLTGDRLSINPSGTLTALVGVVLNVTLKPE